MKLLMDQSPFSIIPFSKFYSFIGKRYLVAQINKI